MKCHRYVRCVAWIGTVLFAGLAQAQPTSQEALRSQFLRNVIADHFVPRVGAFARTAPQLKKTVDALCEAPDAKTLKAARDAWVDTMLAWEGASAIAFGPLLVRRSVFRIDFWPARSNLIERAVTEPPTTVKGLEQIGGPAKGIPAVEWLLWTPPESPEILTDPKRCTYERLLVADIADEAEMLNASFIAFAAAGLPDSVASDAFAGLLNLALGGLEELGVKKIEKPGELGNGKNFPRLPSGKTAAAWNAQWSALRSFLLGDGTGRNDNLDSFLRAQDLAALADKLRSASDRVTKTLQATTEATPATALQAAKDIVLVRTVLVEDIAPSLKIAVQFGANDGD